MGRSATIKLRMPASTLAIIGAPLDLGQDRRGVDMGPSAVRVANLNGRLAELGYTVEDWGNIPVEQKESWPEGEASAKYLAQIAGACNSLAVRVEEALSTDRMPLVLGGDHSVAVGTVSGASRHFRGLGESIGLIWLDAHADMNTPDTSPSGNIHGMPLAFILGMGPAELTDLRGYRPKIDPRRAVIVGIRAFTMRDIDERGMRTVMDEAIRIAADGVSGFHLSLDMDFVDPAHAPGVGTPVRGGATYREAHLALEIIADSEAMVSLEIVEINPVIDLHNQTALLGVEMVLSGLGKKIL